MDSNNLTSDPFLFPPSSVLPRDKSMGAEDESPDNPDQLFHNATTGFNAFVKLLNEIYSVIDTSGESPEEEEIHVVQTSLPSNIQQDNNLEKNPDSNSHGIHSESQVSEQSNNGMSRTTNGRRQWQQRHQYQSPHSSAADFSNLAGTSTSTTNSNSRSSSAGVGGLGPGIKFSRGRDRNRRRGNSNAKGNRGHGSNSASFDPSNKEAKALGNIPVETESSISDGDKFNNLMTMGFKEMAVRRALGHTGYDMDKALELLLLSR